MATNIANLWTPDVWIQTLDEKLQTFPALVSSPIVIRNEEFDAIAAGGGVAANMPYYKDITDQADGIQVENTQPSRQGITAGKQITAILNRETANDANALAAQVSGANPDPIGAIVGQVAIRKQKQRQTVLINILRGVFGFSQAPASANGALKDVRYDAFSETGASPGPTLLIDVNKFVDACALMGENAETLSGGILMHPNIRAALLKQDQISFEHYSTQEGIRLETYKGLRVFVSKALVRAGGVSGVVYDTYVFTPGTVGWGEKPQAAQTVDVASLSYWEDIQKNVREVYDRSRFLMHVNGTRWIGVPAGQSATNAELSTFGNWSLDYTSADRIGIVCIRTNG